MGIVTPLTLSVSVSGSTRTTVPCCHRGIRQRDPDFPPTAGSGDWAAAAVDVTTSVTVNTPMSTNRMSDLTDQECVRRGNSGSMQVERSVKTRR